MYNPQLDTFVKVAEAGSFTKAAQLLYITPTAVIKQMNLLEAHLGVKLFNRTHQGLTLTRAGESLLRDARHIIQYSRESVDRAREAERGEKRVVRVGVSPMTPTAPLSRIWPAAQMRCPGMSMQVVTFENNPQSAREILGNLGQDIDVVAGIYDAPFLRERGCQAIELSREPLHCAVPLSDERLAALDRISLEDLHGKDLLLIQRGWNQDIDTLRDRILSEHPEIRIVDFPQYRIEVFNRAASEGKALTSLAMWSNVHPMLKTLPTDWDVAVSYGIMHAPSPSDYVREFLDALRAELAASV